MTEQNLPLFDLFTQLRQAGLPLGIDEYHLFIRALQHGFGLPDRAALARLCKTLWIKSTDEERLFDYHFEHIIPSEIFHEPAHSAVSSSTSDEAPLIETSPHSAVSSSMSNEAPLIEPNFEISFAPTPTTPTELVLVGDDEVQVANAIRLEISRRTDFEYNHFIQTDEYFPVTRRQMKQSWRYLRRSKREGPPTELDVNATIDAIGREGFLLQPILVPRRTNHAELLLLIDQGGSMIPFHSLSSRLAETALRGGRLGKANMYYFHNCPTDYLYHDPKNLHAESLQIVLNQIQDEKTAVLIFSDAGAARGGFHENRAEWTAQFLNTLKQRVRFIAWLNPMPHTRWLGSTAGEIMQMVPMFDFSRQGLDSAITVLRGRPTVSTYRMK